MSLDTQGFIQTVRTIPSTSSYGSLPGAEVRTSFGRNTTETAAVEGNPLLVWKGIGVFADGDDGDVLQSDSVADRPAGFGARALLVEYIDTSGDAQTTTVAGMPNGVGPYTSDPLPAGLFRINHITVTESGGESPQGTVTVISDATNQTMEPTQGRLSGLAYMVPNGKKARLLSFVLGFQAGPDPVSEVRIRVAKYSELSVPVIDEAIYEVTVLGSGTYHSGPLDLEEFDANDAIKIQFQVLTASTLLAVTGSMTYVVYDA